MSKCNSLGIYLHELIQTRQIARDKDLNHFLLETDQNEFERLKTFRQNEGKEGFSLGGEI